MVFARSINSCGLFVGGACAATTSEALLGNISRIDPKNDSASFRDARSKRLHGDSSSAFALDCDFMTVTPR